MWRLGRAWEFLVLPGTVRRDVTTTVIANVIAAAIIYLVAVGYDYIPGKRGLVIAAVGWLAGAVVGLLVSRGVSQRGARLRSAGGQVPDSVGRIVPFLFWAALATTLGMITFESLVETLPTIALVVPIVLVLITFPAGQVYARQLRLRAPAEDAHEPSPE